MKGTGLLDMVGRAELAVSRRWSAFWFTPQPSSTLTAIRVGLGLTTLCWGLALLPDLSAFYLEGRILPATGYADHRLAVFEWWEGDLAVGVVYVALIAASVGLILGVLVRLAGPVLWLSFVSLTFEAPGITNAGDQLLRVWTAYFALFALLTPSRFLSVPLLGYRNQDGSRWWPAAPTWLVRIMQIQLSVVYVATVIEKLPGDTWRDGTAAYFAFGLEDFQRFPIPDAIRESLVLSNLFTWWTVALEISLPFLLWTRRTRRFAIVAGVLMHVGFDYAMRLGFFLWAMVLGYLSFVRHDEVSRILSWTKRRLPSGVPLRRRPLADLPLVD